MIAIAEGRSTVQARPVRRRIGIPPVTRQSPRVTGVEHDNLDRLIKEVSAQGVVEYAYDALGRRTTMTANGQSPVAYSYDAASRLIQVAQAGLVVGLSYDAVGRRTGLTYPNGTSTSYSYDNASRVTAITHNGPAGLIESLSYAYDAAGNRIGLTRTNGTASNLPQAVQAAYDAANQQIQFNAASPNQTFDANGNQTTSTDATGTTTYTWDARNRLVAQAGPGVTASFAYDALGRRVSKTINGVTTGYLYDGNDIAQEIGGSAVGATYVRSLNIDEPFVRQTSAGNEFYHVDALGSTLDLTNQIGVVQASYHYEAFGKTTMTGTSSNPFQYTGRENDGTGLYYYRTRYYSSLGQRFVSDDPLNSLYFPGVEQRSPVQISKFPRQAVEGGAVSKGIDLLSALSVSQGVSKKLPITQLALSDLSCGSAAGAPEILPPYTYVNNSPIGKGDPTGLGAPSECKQYENDCLKGLNAYSCIAIVPCRTANGPFGEQRGNCIRNCLLNTYRNGCTTIECQIPAHIKCFSVCR